MGKFDKNFESRYHRVYYRLYTYNRGLLHVMSTITGGDPKKGIVAGLVRDAMKVNENATIEETAETVVSKMREMLGPDWKNLEMKEIPEVVRIRQGGSLNYAFKQIFPELVTGNSKKDDHFNGPKQWFFAAVVDSFVSNRGEERGAAREFSRIFNPQGFPEWSGGRRLPWFELQLTKHFLIVTTTRNVTKVRLSYQFRMPPIGLV